MIHTDLHSHTKYSHGADTPAAMYTAALQQGLTVFGFSEHSPRPEGFDYLHEYRDHLNRHLPDYVSEVLELRAAPQEGARGLCRVLFGMEMDWLEGQEDYVRRACQAFDFDYLIGSVHFIGHWGFDDGAGPWKQASQEECEAWYTSYFDAWETMLRSGLFQIAAHPDLIKIFSVEQFHIWLDRPESQDRVRQCLTVLRDAGMAMEVSSAGLRKACREIYPAPLIMRMAAELHIPISFASDAHGVDDVAYGFARLASYAKAFGFREHVLFDRGRVTRMPI
ncbi:MAG: histidinol-phosphatase [Desulfovibrio sp.]|nr:histidinol-phosphatase [Desulfovibrio sp.]